MKYGHVIGLYVTIKIAFRWGKAANFNHFYARHPYISVLVETHFDANDAMQMVASPYIRFPLTIYNPPGFKKAIARACEVAT